MFDLAEVIFYVRHQNIATEFYQYVLGKKPDLNVPGMSEFRLNPNFVLGLMPEKGIKRLLGDAIEDPNLASGIARAELYLRTEDPEVYIKRALDAGGRLLSPLSLRDWGEHVGYVADLDGYVVAFASQSKS